MGHYYNKDGDACHTQATKPGAKSKTRATTVADARKLNLLPSVTTVFDVINKPFLEEWKIKEALKVAYACPPIGNEDADQWISAIKEKASQQVGMAADFGTKIHKALEDEFAGIGDTTHEVMQFIAPALDAITNMRIQEQASEAITVNPEIGYAGCVDLAGWVVDSESLGGISSVPVIVDFKTKKTKAGEKIDVSETYPWQLAAYHVSKFGKSQRELHPFAKAALVFISSTEPGRVETVWFDREQLQHAWECFKATHKLWCLRNKFILT